MLSKVGNHPIGAPGKQAPTFSGEAESGIGNRRELIMEPESSPNSEELFSHPLHPRLQHRQARLGGRQPLPEGIDGAVRSGRLTGPRLAVAGGDIRRSAACRPWKNRRRWKSRKALGGLRTLQAPVDRRDWARSQRRRLRVITTVFPVTARKTRQKWNLPCPTCGRCRRWSGTAGRNC